MLCGLPGSGKSYEAELLAKEHDAVIHSSDKLREQILGDVNNQKKNTDIFDLLHKNIKKDLQAGKNIVYDATNINSKRRMHFNHNILKGITCQKIAIIMATPYRQCIANNSYRERKVPEEVIRRMYLNWQTPYYYEGFSLIQIVLWQDDYMSPTEWLESVISFDQDNHHHSLTLGTHCARVYKAIRSNCDELYYAAMLHDCGKPFTKLYEDSKGNPTEEAHYFQHANVGAYDSFFYMSNVKRADSLLTSWLIEKHMEMYQCDKDEKMAKNRHELWGDEYYGLVEQLHQADKEAH